MTATDAAPTAFEALYEALPDADREAVDVRQGLGESLEGALAGVGLLLPPAADDTAARARQAVAERLGVEVLALDVEGAPQAFVRPPSREACAVVAAAAGEWSRLHGGHLLPDDWHALVVACDSSHMRIATARHRARDLLTTHRDETAAAATKKAGRKSGRS